VEPARCDGAGTLSCLKAEDKDALSLNGLPRRAASSAILTALSRQDFQSRFQQWSRQAFLPVLRISHFSRTKIRQEGVPAP
jgi:hypothetical protein